MVIDRSKGIWDAIVFLVGVLLRISKIILGLLYWRNIPLLLGQKMPFLLLLAYNLGHRS